MIKYALVAGLLTSSLMAAGPYVGVDMGRVDVDYKAAGTSSSVDDTGVTFKGGVLFQPK